LSTARTRADALYPLFQASAQGVVSVGFVIAVYEALVAGELHFWPAAPDSWILPMWVAAASVSGLGLGPLRRLVARLLRRAWPTGAHDPYAELAETVAGARLATPAEDALNRLAEIAVRGTGARAARAVRATADETVPVAVTPAETFPIAVDGRVLGQLVLEPSRRGLSKADRRLATSLADAAGAVLRNAELTAELAEQLRRREAQAAELDRSRRRVVAARDEARERLGQQIQDTVGRALSQGREQASALAQSGDAAGWEPRLAELTELVDTAVKDFRRIVHGVYPATLTDHGLRAALGNLVADLPGSPRFTAPELPRFEARYEAGVYFCVAALLEPVAGDADVRVEFEDGELRVRLSSVHVDWSPGTLEAIRDRVAALDGRLRLDGADLAELLVPIRTEVAA
jgi:signal transduction histidine kinase